MKIAYIITTYPCPSETFIEGEIQSLCKLGLEITVFAASKSKSSDLNVKSEKVFYKPSFFSSEVLLSFIFLITKLPLSVIRFISIVLRFLISCPSESLVLIGNIHTICFFVYNIQRLNISHIHACFLSWPACIGMAIAKMTKKSFSIAAHARDVYVEGGAMELKISVAAFVTCCSNQSLSVIKKRVPVKYHNKLYLNYHGINGLMLRSKNYKSSNETYFTILAVGRLVKKKGFDYLIKAFSDILLDSSKFQLVIVGDGPEWRNLKKLSESLNIRHNCHFTGWLDRRRTLELIGYANVLVVPSIIDHDGDRDGIPNVLIEAFSLQTPVIATTIESITEVVKNEETGLLVEPNDTEQLKSAIQMIFNDEVLSAKMAQNAYIVARRDFNIIKNCTRLKAIFEQIG